VTTSGRYANLGDWKISRECKRTSERREVLNGSMFITSGIEAVMNADNGGDPATTE
jgi:hypothetical protein